MHRRRTASVHHTVCTSPSSLSRAGLVLQGTSAVAFIGMDTPNLPGAEIARGLRQAEEGSAYISPASDGGYVLLAVPAQAPNGVFDEVQWSSERTLDSQVAAVRRAAGIPVATGGTFTDVDDSDGLQQLCASFGTPEGVALCPHTAEQLRQLGVVGTGACSRL
jgi:glycosyltransferase A (GT-A) superfamily protein (DUF2064 family)